MRNQWKRCQNLCDEPGQEKACGDPRPEQKPSVGLVGRRGRVRLVDPGESNVLEMSSNCFFVAAVLDLKFVGDNVEFERMDAGLAPQPLPDELLLGRAAKVVDQICRFVVR